MTSAPSIRSRVLRAVGAAVAITAISFAIGEVVLRVIDHFWPSHIFFDDSYQRFRRKPHTYFYDFRLNSGGFHDLEFPATKGEAYRIVALGDSFAFGMVPYEHNYLTLLEQRLGSREEPVEVLNMGIPCTCPRDQLHLLASEALKLEPDLVFVSFYMGNDLLETIERHFSERRLVDRSHVLSLLRYAFVIWPRVRDQVPPEVPGISRPKKIRVYKDDKPTFTPEEFMWIEVRRAKMYTRGWPQLQPAIDAACDDLAKMRDLCRTHRADFFVAILPDEKQINRWLQQSLARRSEDFAPENVDYLRPTQLLIEGLEKREIHYVDLLPAFLDARGPKRLYRLRDTHWNIAGNRLAARHIAEAMSARSANP